MQGGGAHGTQAMANPTNAAPGLQTGSGVPHVVRCGHAAQADPTCPVCCAAYACARGWGDMLAEGRAEMKCGHMTGFLAYRCLQCENFVDALERECHERGALRPPPGWPERLRVGGAGVSPMDMLRARGDDLVSALATRTERNPNPLTLGQAIEARAALAMVLGEQALKEILEVEGLVDHFRKEWIASSTGWDGPWRLGPILEVAEALKILPIRRKSSGDRHRRPSRRAEPAYHTGENSDSTTEKRRRLSLPGAEGTGRLGTRRAPRGMV